jgi:mycofactocin precursor
MTQPATQTADAAPLDGATAASIETATTPLSGPHNGPARPPAVGPQSGPADDLVQDDLLVEDVSIDGMCGVY